LTLQAVFDDSGTKGTGRFMAMVGLLGEAEAMADLADEWDKYLRARDPGELLYFKLDDARTLDGAFQHWHRHNADAKVQQMARVLDRDDLTLVGAVLDLHAFGMVFQEWEATGHHAFSQPYFLLLENALWVASAEAMRRKSTEQIEIIFDEHDKFAPIVRSRYPALRAIVAEREPARAALMPPQPWFRDDLKFVVLQAADLVAGDARLSEEQDDWIKSLGVLCPKLKAAGKVRPIDEAAMLKYRRSLEEGRI
jgi:uncharacterized protein DUF3800